MKVSKGFVPIEEEVVQEEEDEIQPIIVGEDFGFTHISEKEQQKILNDEPIHRKERSSSSSSSSDDSHVRRRKRHDSDDSSEDVPAADKSALQDEDGDIDLSDLEKAPPVIKERAGLQSASELKEFNKQ